MIYSEECRRKEPPRLFHRRRPPAFRVLIFTYYDPVSFFPKRAPFHSPSAAQYSGYYMNRDGRSSFSFFLALPPSGYYETRFQRKVKDRERGEVGGRRWKTSDVCPRGIVIFIGSQLSRGFSFSCPACSLPPSPSIAARRASGNESTLLFIRREVYAGRSSGRSMCRTR